MRFHSLFLASLLLVACGGDDDPAACEGAVAGEADDCCPDGATSATDPDCEPPDAECGNGTEEEGEQCDDGNLDPGDGCDESCQAEPTAYRVNTLELKDPHLFALGALDVTGQVNQSIQAGITSDDPPNGSLDLSLVFVFKPADPTAATTDADAVIAAACTVPAETTMCTTDADSSVIPTTATNGQADCLLPIDGTTGNYQPAITTPGGPCFSTDAEQVEVTAGGVTLRLTDARVGGTYGAGTPPASLGTGLFYGFMTEEDADNTMIPADTPVVGGDPLSSVLSEDDKDDHNGTPGWWFYFNFTAETVPFTEGT